MVVIVLLNNLCRNNLKYRLNFPFSVSTTHRHKVTSLDLFHSSVVSCVSPRLLEGGMCSTKPYSSNKGMESRKPLSSLKMSPSYVKKWNTFTSVLMNFNKSILPFLFAVTMLRHLLTVGWLTPKKLSCRASMRTSYRLYTSKRLSNFLIYAPNAKYYNVETSFIVSASHYTNVGKLFHLHKT